MSETNGELFKRTEKFLDSLIDGTLSEAEIFDLYGSKQGKCVVNEFNFLKERDGYSAPIPRQRLKEYATPIKDAQFERDNSEIYLNLQEQINIKKVPTIRELHYIFGKYASLAKSMIDYCDKYVPDREGGIPAGRHWHDVSWLSHLILNDAIIGLLHDTVEDLYPYMPSKRRKDKKPYRITQERLFYEDLIPVELHESLREISNYRATKAKRIEKILESQELAFNKTNFLKLAKQYRRQALNHNISVSNKFSDTMLDLIHIVSNFPKTEIFTFDNLKNQLYEPYVFDVATKSLGVSPKMYRLKQLDFTENIENKNLSDTRQIKILNKGMLIVDVGRNKLIKNEMSLRDKYSINPDSQEFQAYLNREPELYKFSIENIELEQRIIEKGRKIVLKHLATSHHKVSYFLHVWNNFKALENVFYSSNPQNQFLHSDKLLF